MVSPELLKLYLSGVPLPAYDIKIVITADDLTIKASGPFVGDVCVRVKANLAELADFLNATYMKISANKSTATLCTIWTAEKITQLNVQVEGQIITTTIKILGDPLDSTFKSSTQSTAICA